MLLCGIGHYVPLIVTENRPPGLLVMLSEFLVDLFGCPMLIDHSVCPYVNTGPVHIHFTGGVTGLHFRVVDNRPEPVELVISWRFKDSSLNLNPIHSKLFAQPLFLSLRIGSERNDGFYALVVQSINVLHFRILSSRQVRRYLFSRSV